MHEYPCPKGTYSNQTMLQNVTQCVYAPGGMYVDIGSYTPTPTGQTNVFGVIGNQCPQGSYCPQGSSNPTPCPAGTYGASPQLPNVSSCSMCDPGFICPTTGLVSASTLCPAGSYCPGGQVTGAEHSCPLGSACPLGSIVPQPCAAGTFANNTGQSVCSPCPPQFYCLNNASVPLPCPAGYFCPSQTQFATQFACPAGSISNQAQLQSAAQCDDCPPGHYCNGQAPTNVPSGRCAPSFYCSKRATGPRPNDTTGGLCSPGYVCLDGSSVPNPTDGVTGFACPPGNYCPMGSAFPVGCTPGTASTPRPVDGATGNICPFGFYCPQATTTPLLCPETTYSGTLGQAQCTPCPAGSFCDGVLTDRHQVCPQGAYCPPSTGASQPPCPVGSFNNGTGLPAITNCTVCTPGSFCASVGLVQPTALCQAGFFCNAGAVNAFGQTTSQLVNGTLSANASSCPSGSYCPVGTYQPVPCPVGTYLPTRGGRQLSDCQLCTPGQYCDTTGAVAPSGPCDPGYFCQHNNAVARPTSMTTVNSMQLGGGVCPVANFCPGGSSAPTLCAAGTYSISTGASQCTPCPAGTTL
ncbi:hypothetical protein SPRG_17985 [Saprolegnia parasitica CBS 223.65]|uniref:Tyrosine-protein kinase ephrin type A/B receptor-like domain-containing protein n=1 Tax=Saprolegnia parasitica (strain CBS 223.65) TaxID=695850 RepID=A0A067BIC2_SAPPC|nr:hypothetical protein SPRG_17985 [Saprolegnia parasitica CBS 223.65]KDO16495.1 hypothetical protein SPRG_17985 [Saprolegnia parasitica CBS 223.65]|eukprot:XP_012212797.1 hypothetical protein SPRG_17985 [Saprolegnia parasitica CBS 223.65]